MKKIIKRSPYATLSADTVKAPNKPKKDVRADRIEGGDLRARRESNGK